MVNEGAPRASSGDNDAPLKTSWIVASELFTSPSLDESVEKSTLKQKLPSPRPFTIREVYDQHEAQSRDGGKDGSHRRRGGSFADRRSGSP